MAPLEVIDLMATEDEGVLTALAHAGKALDDIATRVAPSSRAGRWYWSGQCLGGNQNSEGIGAQLPVVLPTTNLRLLHKSLTPMTGASTQQCPSRR